MFQNLGHMFEPPTQYGQPTAPPASSNYKTPPASKRVLASLPQVKVTADDILEVTNKECLICLEEQKIGSWACKLQCGHLFHKHCVAEWLEKHCTCPVCRFELETDDTAYESERKKRMRHRKLRLRMDEINNKSIGQLRELAQNLNVNISGCIDKTEIIDKLVKSGCIEVTEGLPPMEMTREEFNSKTVSQLKFLLLSFGISDRDVIEKSELRSKLIASGRIVFKERSNSNTTVESVASSNYGDVPSSSGPVFAPPLFAGEKGLPAPMDQEHDQEQDRQGAQSSSSEATNGFSSGLSGGNSRTASTASIRSTQSEEGYFVLLSDLRGYSLAELRELCARYQVSTAGCVEKAEIIERLLESGHIQLLPPDQQLSAKADHISEESPPVTPMSVASPSGTPQSKASSSSDRSDSGAGMDVCSGGGGGSAASTPVRAARLNAYDHCAPHSAASGSADANLSAHGQEPYVPEDTRLALSVSLLLDMSVREVRSVMDAYKIDTTGCLEKTDMISRIQACHSIRIVN